MNTVYDKLISLSDKPLNYNEEVKKDIALSVSYEKDFCCKNPEYLATIEHIRSTKPQIIKRDTVGHYLYGCIAQIPIKNIQTYCSPECVYESLKDPQKLPCKTPSYEKYEQSIKKINDIKGTDANLFLRSDQKITPQDITFLRNQGVKFVTLYTQDEDGITYILGDTVPTTEPITTPTPTPTPTTIYNYWWVALIIFIIIIILFAIIGGSRYY